MGQKEKSNRTRWNKKIEKWNQMTALRFQRGKISEMGETSEMTGLPSFQGMCVCGCAVNGLCVGCVAGVGRKLW